MSAPILRSPTVDLPEPITPHGRLRYGVRRGIGPEEADLRLRAVEQVCAMSAALATAGVAGLRCVDDHGRVDVTCVHADVDTLTGHVPADHVDVRRLAILLTHAYSKGAGNVRYTPAGWAQSPLGVLCGRVFARER